MNPQVEAIQAKLRQIDDYQSKGLLRAEEAEAQRDALMKKLMELLVPDTPAPKLPLRVRAWGAVAMLVLVGGFTAYLISGHAGLRARSELILEQGRIAAAQDAQSRKERMERIRRGESLAPDQFGRFASDAVRRVRRGARVGCSRRFGARPPRQARRRAPAPRRSPRCCPAASCSTRSSRARSPPTTRCSSSCARPTTRTACRSRRSAWRSATCRSTSTSAPREMIGSPDRFMHADKVIVSARVSKSGSGHAEAGRPGRPVGAGAALGQRRAVHDRPGRALTVVEGTGSDVRHQRVDD